MKKWSPEDIKKLRLKHNLTQKSLGRLLGVTRNYVHYMEKGEIEVGTTFAIMLDQIERTFKDKNTRKWSQPFSIVGNLIKRKR